MKYYIQNADAGFLGNAIIFWAKDGRGYTCDLNNAHQFTEDEAEEICLNNRKNNRAWPVEYIDKSKGIMRVIDSQFIDKGFANPFKKSPPTKIKLAQPSSIKQHVECAVTNIELRALYRYMEEQSSSWEWWLERIQLAPMVMSVKLTWAKSLLK